LCSPLRGQIFVKESLLNLGLRHAGLRRSSNLRMSNSNIPWDNRSSLTRSDGAVYYNSAPDLSKSQDKPYYHNPNPNTGYAPSTSNFPPSLSQLPASYMSTVNPLSVSQPRLPIPNSSHPGYNPYSSTQYPYAPQSYSAYPQTNYQQKEQQYSGLFSQPPPQQRNYAIPNSLFNEPLNYPLNIPTTYNLSMESAKPSMYTMNPNIHSTDPNSIPPRAISQSEPNFAPTVQHLNQSSKMLSKEPHQPISPRNESEPDSGSRLRTSQRGGRGGGRHQNRKLDGSGRQGHRNKGKGNDFTWQQHQNFIDPNSNK